MRWLARLLFGVTLLMITPCSASPVLSQLLGKTLQCETELLFFSKTYAAPAQLTPSSTAPTTMVFSFF